MSSARLIIGDVHEALAALPAGSVDLVMTSPPFLALRSYLPSDHPHKDKEIGREATPAGFLDALLDVVEACDRVLAPHGSIVFELGDTYSGSGGGGGDYQEGGMREGQPGFVGSAAAGRDTVREAAAAAWRAKNADKDAWPLPKSLTGIPTLFAWSLAYGRNLLRPERTTDRWRIRNVVVWARPNPAIGLLGDKFRPATSYLTVACKAKDRYFDLDAVRTKNGPGGNATRRSSLNRSHPGEHTQEDRGLQILDNPAGAPPLDHWWHDEDAFIDDTWHLSTSPYQGSHYATYPAALCELPIKAMCPLKVCTVCGLPSRRISEDNEEYRAFRAATGDFTGPEREMGVNIAKAAGSVPARYRTTTGWTDCGHASWRTGVVLDPFAGSGTTLMVATGHGRDAIGVDLDARNADLAMERVGPLMLSVEQLEQA